MMSDSTKQDSLVFGLRSVVAGADRLARCPDVDAVHKHAVEFARDELGLERCAIFMADDGFLQGTYGVGMSGGTVPEHRLRFRPRDAWMDYIRGIKPLDAAWQVNTEMRSDYNAETGENREVGVGWVAMTPILSGGRVIGVFFNDCAVSNAEMNPTLQEVVSVFCSLLGSIIERKRAEAALQEERDLLHMVIDLLPDSVYVKDAEGRHLLVNAELAQSAGMASADELVGKTDFDLFPPDRAARYHESDVALMQTGQPQRNIEDMFEDEAGSRTWRMTTKLPLKNGQGLVGVSRDITDLKRAQETLKRSNDELEARIQERVGELKRANEALQSEMGERRQAEEQLHQSEARFAQVFQKSPVGIVVIRLSDATFLDMNARYLDMMGYTREELIGTPARAVHSPLTLVEYERIREAVAARKALSDFDATITTKAGERREAQVSLEIMEIDGETCILGMIHDITERKRMEKVLAEEQTLLRTLIDALPDYIFAKDTQGRFTLSNKAHARAGNATRADLHPSEFVGKSAADFFPAEMAARFDADDQALLQSGQPLYNVERVTLDANGQKIYVATTKVPLRDAEGNLTGLVGISRDITDYKKAQETLKQQEDFLRQVIDVSPNLIWVKDWDGKYILSNKKHAEAVGLSVGEVVGKKDADFQSDPAEAEQFVRHDREVMTTLKPKYIPAEVQTSRATGEQVWLQTTKVPLVAPDGVTPWVLGVAADVTQQHLAEEALLASEERYRMLTELISDYAFSMRVKPDGELEDEWVTADSFERFTGYKPDETGTGLSLYHPNDVDKVRTQLADVLAGKAVSQEVRILRKDGELRWMQLRRQPVWDARAGRVFRYYGVAQDITERKRAQEALQQAHDDLEARITLRTADLALANELLLQEIQERQQAQEALAVERNLLRTLIDNLPQFIYIKDRETRFVVTNRAHAMSLLGEDTPDAMIGKTDADFYPPDMIPQFQLDDRSVLDSGQPVVDREEVSLDENHHPIWLLTNKLPLRNSRGEVTGLVGIGLNITERKRAEEALQQSHDDLEQRVQERTADLLLVNEEVKRFAYIVSHDLRAPLVNIKGFASELRSSLVAVQDAMEPCFAHLNDRQRRDVTEALDRDVPEALGFINASVERMNYLINAILQLSRLGQRRLQMGEINVNDLVREMIKSLGHQIAAHSATVTIGDLPALTADRTAMEQIFGNILGNAVLYLSPERAGKIEITGERRLRETVYHVRDNGVGIADDDRAKVFELFRRAGKPTVPGEGIGLAYVQALVRRHQGRIWFESELGTGTTFSFAIPHQLTPEDGTQAGSGVVGAAHG